MIMNEKKTSTPCAVQSNIIERNVNYLVKSKYDPKLPDPKKLRQKVLCFRLFSRSWWVPE